MEKEKLTKPIEPKSVGTLTNADVLFGNPIPAIERLRHTSSDAFEDIIREWIAGYCNKNYNSVWRAGGAGDKGRDVVGIINKDTNEYDNYQCKHYDHPLAPSDIWSELIKLCCYTKRGDFDLPKKYSFVAPQGVGPKLGNLILKPKELKEELYSVWDKYKDVGDVKSDLDDDLKAHIDKIDFSIITFLDPQDLIEQHRQTEYFASRFGGGLQARRPTPKLIGFEKSETSLRFIEQLFKAYEEHFNIKINGYEDLSKFSEEINHFNRQRNCFYWAESLDQFSRDQLPKGNTCFADLKEEIFQGVIDICDSNYSNGYERVKNTTAEATKLNLQSNALLSVSVVQDKIGICHHLVNDKKLTWVK